MEYSETFFKSKPKIFYFGACDGWDAVDSDCLRYEFDIDRYYFRKSMAHVGFNETILRHDPELNEQKNQWRPAKLGPPPLSDSLLSMATTPGELADRLFEFIKEEYRLDSDTTGPDFQNYFNLLQDFTKWPYIKFYQTFAGPNDFLVLNFSTELYTKFFKTECVTLCPILTKIFGKNEKFRNRFKELEQEQFHRSFDQPDVLGPTIELVKDFARDLSPIFQNRVILLKSQLANTFYSDNLNDVEHLKINTQSIPFYRPTKIMLHPNDKGNVERLLNLAVKGFQRHYSSDIPLLELDDRDVFLDPNHRYGLSPFHLHKVSTDKLGLKIYGEIKRIQAEQ
jgi:hypothetical protein